MNIFTTIITSDHPPQPFYKRLALAIPLTALFTLIQIQQSLAVGRLSALPQYDDVVHHLDALTQLQAIRSGDPLAFIKAMLSTWSVSASTLGYLLLGPAPWSTYAINALLILAMLALIDWITPNASLRVKSSCWIVALCLPLMGHTITDFRPDFAAAFATAGAILAVLMINASPATRKAAVIAGVLTGIALLAKPHIFAATIVYVGIAGLIMTLREIYQCRKDPDSKYRDLLINIALTASISTVIASAHFARFGLLYFNYFWENTFGDRAKNWDRNLAGFENIDYFLRGQGGTLVFGRQLLPILILAAAGTLSVILARQRALKHYIIQLWIVSFGCLIIPATNATKNPYFALVFGVLVLIIAIIGLRHMLAHQQSTINRLHRAVGLVVSITLIVWSVAAFDFPRNTPGAITPTSRPGFDPAASDAMARSVAQELVDARPLADQALKASGKPGEVQVYLTTSGYVNKDTLAYLILLEGHSNWHFSHGTFIENPEYHTQRIAKAHLIVANEPGVADEQGRPLIHRYQGDQATAQLLEIIRADPSLKEIASIPSPAGPEIIIFVRADR